MKKVALIAVAAISLAAMTSCAKAPEERLSGFAEEFANMMIANDGDCAKLAAKIDEFQAKNGAEITKAIGELKTPVADAMAAYVSTDTQEKLKSMKCAGDKAVQDSMAKVGLGAVEAKAAPKAEAKAEAKAAPAEKKDKIEEVGDNAEKVGDTAVKIGDAAEKTIGAGKGIAEAFGK